MKRGLRVLLQRWHVLLLATVCYAFAGLIVALPLWESMTASGLVQLPDADRKLWSPGGLLLIEWLRLEGRQLAGAFNVSLWLLVLFGAVLLFPVALLFAALSEPVRTSYVHLVYKSFVCLPPFALLWGLTLLMRACLLTALLLVWQGSLAAASTPSKPWLTLAALSLATLGWCLTGLLQDMARAWVMGHDAGVFRAIGLSLKNLATRPIAMLVAYLVPNALTVSIILLASWISKFALGMAASSAFPLALFGFNVCLLLVLALRTLWFERTVSIAFSFSLLAPDDTRANSDAPGDPNPNRDA